MQHLPIFLDVKGKSALVVGGGAAAAAKVRLLNQAGARVSVIAAAVAPDLAELATGDDVEVHRRAFLDEDLNGRTLVIAATGDRAEDARISQAARAMAVPVNVVDSPDLSDFLMPAIVDRDPVTVAISTGGTAPVLARSIRSKIEAMLPANLGALARFAAGFRSAVKANYRDAVARRRFWERFFAGPLAAAVLNGNRRWAMERMLPMVNGRDPEISAAGVVYIVGAGPGAADLLTVRALRLLQEADVIVYDRLIEPQVLEYARRDAERIYVGKAKGQHSRSQQQINSLLVDLAREGRRVVRLKGGDPLVFGRGGEERDHLLRHGIHTEIVSGVTAATGCAAAAGIPLTHRDFAQAVTFVTGHGKDGEPDLDWAALARHRQTLVIYMGGSTAASIARRLIDNGMDRATPSAVIANGARSGQRVETGRLADLSVLAGRAGAGPALIVVGEVVRQADAWLEPAPRRAVAV